MEPNKDKAQKVDNKFTAQEILSSESSTKDNETLDQPIKSSEKPKSPPIEEVEISEIETNDESSLETTTTLKVSTEEASQLIEPPESNLKSFEVNSDIEKEIEQDLENQTKNSNQDNSDENQEKLSSDSQKTEEEEKVPEMEELTMISLPEFQKGQFITSEITDELLFYTNQCKSITEVNNIYKIQEFKEIAPSFKIVDKSKNLDNSNEPKIHFKELRTIPSDHLFGIYYVCEPIFSKDQNLTLFQDDSYYVDANVVNLNSYEIGVNIASLKQDHINKVKPFLIGSLEDLGVSYTFTEEILLKKNLRNYKMKSGQKEGQNMTILVHKVDGRLLLTGKSGIYEDYIRAKLPAYRGNFMLILLDEFQDDLDPLPDTLEEPQELPKLVEDCKIYEIEGNSYAKTEELKISVYDPKIISNLADPAKGNQPIVQTLAENFKLIYVKGVVNYYQLQVITQNFKKSLFWTNWSKNFEKHGFQGEELPVEQSMQQEQAVAKNTFSQIKLQIEEEEFQDDPDQLEVELAKIGDILDENYGMKIEDLGKNQNQNCTLI